MKPLAKRLIVPVTRMRYLLKYIPVRPCLRYILIRCLGNDAHPAQMKPRRSSCPGPKAVGNCYM